METSTTLHWANINVHTGIYAEVPILKEKET